MAGARYAAGVYDRERRPGPRALTIGLLGVVLGIIAIAVHGPALSLRFHGTRVTATVTSCHGVTWHGKSGEQHRTECEGEWTLPGGTVDTGEIDGAADAIGAYAEGESSIEVHERLAVWATDTEALAVRDDPTGWLWGGGLLILVGAAVLAGSAWHRRTAY
ncbi:hypothetical protein GCM10022220_01120 [Actinocatenispora rupis]|uniref:Uncharacterized protein n=1 Tax=Actinocatenispora rupis TaxID=519421 RepID=A0A8J3J945_9ACTN|nr:hypothetical protein Aru02nite_50660 [Actinocatenispora rupis]